MNHYKARKRMADGRFDYTNANDRTGCYAIGYCAGLQDWTSEKVRKLMGAGICEQEAARQEKFKDKYHSDGHATEEEARQCYTNYLLDQRTRYDSADPTAKRKCQFPTCEEWTHGQAVVEGRTVITLCDGHRNREIVAQLYGVVSESWGSL